MLFINKYTVMEGAEGMAEEKLCEQNVEDIPEKKSFIAWVKEHKPQLLLAGLSVTTIIMTILGIKNKEALSALWDSLKKQIEKGAMYSNKWFENASLEELETAREVVRLDYVNPDLDLDYRNQCWNLLSRFDNAISKIKWAGKEVGYPVHSSHGWHLPSDD